MLKRIHLTSKDIAKIFHKELYIPKFLAYIFWYVALLIGTLLGGIKKWMNQKKI